MTDNGVPPLTPGTPPPPVPLPVGPPAPLYPDSSVPPMAGPPAYAGQPPAQLPYTQQPSAQQQPYSQQAWPQKPPTGAMYYALGFIAYIPIPFIGLLIGAIVMVATFSSSQKKGGLIAENGRRASNWGLTVIGVMVVLILWVVVLATVFNGQPWSTPAGPIVVYLALGVAHLVILIMGLVKANAGTVFENKLALNILR